jgi:hypothetical protein
MLFARHAAALAVQIRRERANHRIEYRYRRNLKPPAILLKQLAQLLADQGKKNDPRIGLDASDHPFDLVAGAHHAPDVFNRVHLVELDEAGSRYGMHRLAGRVGDEMKVKPRHCRRAVLGNSGPMAMCMTGKLSTISRRLEQIVAFCPRFAILANIVPGYESDRMIDLWECELPRTAPMQSSSFT